MATFVLSMGLGVASGAGGELLDHSLGADMRLFMPTLTGLGERSHLLTPDINLDTHILDVVNVMKWQVFNNVVLVGHSYAGMVISGVAEKLKKSIFS
jgi:hypothetical protein